VVGQFRNEISGAVEPGQRSVPLREYALGEKGTALFSSKSGKYRTYFFKSEESEERILQVDRYEAGGVWRNLDASHGQGGASNGERVRVGKQTRFGGWARNSSRVHLVVSVRRDGTQGGVVPPVPDSGKSSKL
jgi:hypothetical protein